MIYFRRILWLISWSLQDDQGSHHMYDNRFGLRKGRKNLKTEYYGKVNIIRPIWVSGWCVCGGGGGGSGREVGGKLFYVIMIMAEPQRKGSVKKNAAEAFLCCVLGFMSTVNSYVWSCLDGQFTYHTFSRQA